MRINKFLASCGLASRRNCEALVTAGRVRLNGKPVSALATEVGAHDVVEVDGVRVRPAETHLYLMFHKPKGCVCTVHDDRGRKTVMDFLPERDERLFPVGRLDYDTEGLLLLTTDGDFANRIAHPSTCVPKTYVARVEGVVTEQSLERLRRGVTLDDGTRTRPAKARLLDVSERESRVEIVLSEGKNRQVKRMFEAIGHSVLFLKRTAIGPLRLGGLARGACRPLTEREIAYFVIPSARD